MAKAVILVLADSGLHRGQAGRPQGSVRRRQVRGLNVDRALIDGEAVVLRKDGRSDFGALMTKRGNAEATLVAFDLLRLNGDDLRPQAARGAARYAPAARGRR
jgi:hypothetical protein